MTELEKLRVMLPHWIEHNRSHGEEFKKWADIIKGAGAADIAALIEAAYRQTAQAEQALSQISSLELAQPPLKQAMTVKITHSAMLLISHLPVEKGESTTHSMGAI